ncbi:MAG: hypothetical protein H0X66_07000 [Verrucomicrobia bacterium]|nr:hypothetical protein [Verrucomicrobiota bacterium]
MFMNEGDKKKKPRIIEGYGIVDYLPEPFVTVLVHAETHTCQAYVDKIGIWRSPFNDKPITSRVVSWEPI